MRFFRNTTEQIICFTLFVLLLIPSLYAAEFYLVVSDEANLFLDRKLVTTLPKDTIVAGRDDPAYRGWIELLYNDVWHNANADDFRSRQELREKGARDAAGLDAKLTLIEAQIQRSHNRLKELYGAAALARFDSTVQYRIRITRTRLIEVVPKQTDGTHRVPGARQEKEYKRIQETVYRHVDRLSPRSADRLIETWEEQIEEQWTSLQKQQKERLDILRKQVDVALTAKYLEERFETFAASGSSSATQWQRYLVVKDEAVLYQNNHVHGELTKGTVVTARPNPDFGKWLLVDYRGVTYDSRKQFYSSKTNLLKEYQQELNKDKQQLEDLKQRKKLMDFTLDLLNTLKTQLELETDATYFILDHDVFLEPFGIKRFYPYTQMPNESRQIILSSRVKRVMRDWDDLRKQLQKQTARIEKNIIKLSRSIAGRQTQFERIERLLETAP